MTVYYQSFSVGVSSAVSVTRGGIYFSKGDFSTAYFPTNYFGLPLRNKGYTVAVSVATSEVVSVARSVVNILKKFAAAVVRNVLPVASVAQNNRPSATITAVNKPDGKIS